jgi:hypothetical protein
MSEITEFEQLMPLLDQTDLSEVNVHLDNKLALDISDFVKSKGIHHDKMCNWFCQISKTTISTKVLVSRLHRLKTLVSKKRGEKKSMLLEELFEIDTSEASAKQAPQALKEPVESLVQKLENTEQKHLNDIQSMKRKYENTSEEKEKEIKKIKKANQNLEFKVQKQSNTIKQLRYHSKSFCSVFSNFWTKLSTGSFNACGACLADASEVSISNNSSSSLYFFSPLFLLTRVFKRCRRDTKTLVEMFVFEICHSQKSLNLNN